MLQLIIKRLLSEIQLLPPYVDPLDNLTHKKEIPPIVIGPKEIDWDTWEATQGAKGKKKYINDLGGKFFRVTSKGIVFIAPFETARKIANKLALRLTYLGSDDNNNDYWIETRKDTKILGWEEHQEEKTNLSHLDSERLKRNILKAIAKLDDDKAKVRQGKHLSVVDDKEEG